MQIKLLPVSQTLPLYLFKLFATEGISEERLSLSDNSVLLFFDNRMLLSLKKT